MKRPIQILLMATVLTISEQLTTELPSETTGVSTAKTSVARRPSSKQQDRSRKSHPARTTSGPQFSKPPENMEEIIMQAQNKLRLLDGYSNTPPTFITASRDLYVDVAEFPLGTALTTIKANDENNNTIEYSIQPASQQDASAYFSIDSRSGQLTLANKSFQYFASQETGEKSQSNNTDELTEDIESTYNQQAGPHRNIYFLHVVADNGHYRSDLELQVHVMNTSSADRHHVRLTPQGESLPQKMMSVKNILRDRTRDFIERQYGSVVGNQTATVFPNYVNIGPNPNPSTSSQEVEQLKTYNQEEVAQTTSTMSPISTSTTTSSPIIVELPSSSQHQVGATRHQPPAADMLSPEPMVVSLVVACSCLMIALVLLMFLVPISVKRLRKRLKHVERQHEQLSKTTSHGSSTVCSASTTSMVTQSHHNPSWSHLTLSSDQQSSCMMSGSSVCRQSSLDSSLTGLPIQPSMFNNRTLNRVIGSISNPAYLHQQQQQQQCLQNQTQTGMLDIVRPTKQQIVAQQSHLFTQVPPERLGVDCERCDNQYDLIDLDDEFRIDQEAQAMASKTVARSSNISREHPEQSEHLWELDRLRLKDLKILDEGQFGLVWRCKLKQANNQELTVAVKTLKKRNAIDPQSREELLAEIEVMKLVSMHPNVVKILHCCTSHTELVDGGLVLDSKPILLIMEYVELGKLQSFLEKSRINHHYATSHYDGTTTDQHLTSKDLVKFIYHVAKGMEYISSQCIVHRDLASRNVLVSSQRVCKIGDFGMARHMKSLDAVYERHSRQTKVPVRWMAPEVLLNNRFTTKSDVYSFGILMWEIVTLGSAPYRHLETNRVIEAVARNGERPEKPEYCHAQLYNIMSRCWSHDPDNRPTFSSLVRHLDELLLSTEDYIELDQYPGHDYYNMPIYSSIPN